MGRSSLPTTTGRTITESWRERVFWTGLAVLLIAFLLLGLITLARWGDARGGPGAASGAPGVTGLASDLLLVPPLPPGPVLPGGPPPVVAALPPLQRPDPAACDRARSPTDVRPVALGADGAARCVVTR